MDDKIKIKGIYKPIRGRWTMWIFALVYLILTPFYQHRLRKETERLEVEVFGEVRSTALKGHMIAQTVLWGLSIFLIILGIATVSSGTGDGLIVVGILLFIPAYIHFFVLNFNHDRNLYRIAKCLDTYAGGDGWVIAFMVLFFILTPFIKQYHAIGIYNDICGDIEFKLLQARKKAMPDAYD